MVEVARSLGFPGSFEKEMMHKGLTESDKDVLKLSVTTVFNVLGKNINERIPEISGSGITLTNNDIKVILKATRSLGNKGTLLKGTTGII